MNHKQFDPKFPSSITTSVGTWLPLCVSGKADQLSATGPYQRCVWWGFLRWVFDLSSGVPLRSLRVPGPAGHGGQRRQPGPRPLWSGQRLPAAATSATLTHAQPAALPALSVLLIFLTLPLRAATPPCWRGGLRMPFCTAFIIQTALLSRC